ATASFNAMNFSTLNGINASTIQAQATVTVPGNAGGTPQYAGVSVRFNATTGEGDHYWGGIVGQNGVWTLQIIRVVNGVSTQVASVPTSSGSGTVKLTASGGLIQLYLNGNLATSYNDANPLAGGSVGIRGSANTTFDNFSAS